MWRAGGWARRAKSEFSDCHAAGWLHAIALIKKAQQAILYAMRIVKLGSAVLREKALPVERVTDEIKALAAEMIETMHKEKGVGLAAPQVGKNIRMFVADSGSGAQVFINPQITGTSLDLVEMEEGCLSIPGFYEKVVRPESIRLQAQDESGRRRVVNASGYLARIIQHEYDHLEGVLFIDKIDPEKKTRIERRFEKMAQKEARKGKWAARKKAAAQSSGKDA